MMDGSGNDRDTVRRLRTHIDRLADDIGVRNLYRPRALADAAAYIEAEWRDLGYTVTRQWYEVDGVRCANLEIERRGRDRADEILLISAHYDTVSGSPGANDNGSGVAALIELARGFLAVEPALTVRFVAFVNEEPPFFMTGQRGSMVYARAARARGDDIRLMAALETIGYYDDAPGSQRYPPLFGFFHPDRGNFLAFVSNFRSRRAMRRAAPAFRDNADFPLEHTATLGVVPGVDWSEHRSFWKHGYRAMMVTDTAFYRYPYYHSPLDTADKIAYPAFSRATGALFRCFRKLSHQGL